MYSFEKRSPASSVWVNPAATRSCLTRSPSCVEALARVRVCKPSLTIPSFTSPHLNRKATNMQEARGTDAPKGARRSPFLGGGDAQNHLTELLDSIPDPP